jgi:hypothetical protein
MPLLLVASAACGPPSAPAAQPTSPTSVEAKPSGAAPAAISGERFDVAEGRATIRIREQLVTWTVPDDAILTLAVVEGAFALRDDGTFDPASLLKAPLRYLESDDFRRANAARESMNADRFPVVEFRPIRVSGLRLPLPAAGEWQFRMQGELKVNGVKRELEWDAIGKRAGDTLTATAQTKFQFGDFAMDVPRRGPVLSIVDEIRLQVFVTARTTTIPASCAPTPQDVPANYVPGTPERSRIGAGGYVFQGVVRSSAGCGPLPGARVEIWLANPSGEYDADHRATVVADGSGRYRLVTSRPAAYGGGRAHIHIRVTADRHRTLVAIFFPDDGTLTGEMDLVMEPN